MENTFDGLLLYCMVFCLFLFLDSRSVPLPSASEEQQFAGGRQAEGKVAACNVCGREFRWGWYIWCSEWNGTSSETMYIISKEDLKWRIKIKFFSI